MKRFPLHPRWRLAARAALLAASLACGARETAGTPESKPNLLVIWGDDIGITNISACSITSNTYYDWLIDHVFFLVPAQTYVANFLSTFREFPPRQKPVSFSIDQALKMLEVGAGASN